MSCGGKESEVATGQTLSSSSWFELDVEKEVRELTAKGRSSAM